MSTKSFDDTMTLIRRKVSECERDVRGMRTQTKYTLCMLGPERYRELMAGFDYCVGGGATFIMGLRIVGVRSEGVWFE